MNKSMNHHPIFFPMLVDIRERACLVVGAGEVAESKIAGLLHYNARIEVVSPRAVQGIQDRATAGKITWHRRRFHPGDVTGKFLVVAATSSARTNRAVFSACTEQGILCNSVDDPDHCNFIYPAVVRRGPLQIAISTAGCSPALAAQLRKRFELQFGPEWSDWVQYLGRRRQEILEAHLSPVARKKLLHSMITARAFCAFMRRHYPDAAEPTQKKPRNRSRNGRT